MYITHNFAGDLVDLPCKILGFLFQKCPTYIYFLNVIDKRQEWQTFLNDIPVILFGWG